MPNFRERIQSTVKLWQDNGKDGAYLFSQDYDFRTRFHVKLTPMGSAVYGCTRVNENRQQIWQRPIVVNAYHD